MGLYDVDLLKGIAVVADRRKLGVDKGAGPVYQVSHSVVLVLKRGVLWLCHK